jgi:hypothetical protein
MECEVIKIAMISAVLLLLLVTMTEAMQKILIEGQPDAKYFRSRPAKCKRF